MILTDFVPLTEETRKELATIDRRSLEDAFGLQKRLGAYSIIRVDAKTSDEKKVLTDMESRTSDALHERRADILLKSGTLPDELLIGDDPLTKAARTPKIELTTVRHVADKLSFAVLPYQYLDERSYEKESREMQKAIKTFAADLERWFDIYVLAPIHFYDVYKHVKARDDISLYPGIAVAQTFMAISMAIPMFRSLMGDMEQIRDAVRSIDARTRRAESELKNLSRRLEELGKQVEAQQAQMIIAQAREKAVRLELEALQERTAFMAYDPMMLALPKGTILSGNGRAIVGPCWGPDFQDIVISALGFKKVEGQRQKLDQLAARWAGSVVRNRYQ